MWTASKTSGIRRPWYNELTRARSKHPRPLLIRGLLPGLASSRGRSANSRQAAYAVTKRTAQVRHLCPDPALGLVSTASDALVETGAASLTQCHGPVDSLSSCAETDRYSV
jgi:hypothetical protein